MVVWVDPQSGHQTYHHHHHRTRAKRDRLRSRTQESRILTTAIVPPRRPSFTTSHRKRRSANPNNVPSPFPKSLHFYPRVSSQNQHSIKGINKWHIYNLLPIQLPNFPTQRSTSLFGISTAINPKPPQVSHPWFKVPRNGATPITYPVVM